MLLTSKAELDELMNGIESLGVLSMIRNNPALALQLFLYQRKDLTANNLYDMFKYELSPESSNQRAREEAQLFNWVTFLQTVESML